MTEENVNFVRKFTDEVNTFPKLHLSQQMRKILQFLYEHRDHVWQQVDIISSIYPSEPYLTPSRISSVSRSMKTLMKAQFVESRKSYYSDRFSAWISQRVHYYITEKGEQFAKELK